MTQIHAYFDYGSIYSYLAWKKLDLGINKLDGEILWKPVSAFHIISQDGHKTNADYANWNSYTIADAMRIAKQIGAPLKESQIRPHNAIHAMRIHLLADHLGPEMERRWMKRVFTGIFEEGKDPTEANLQAWCDELGIVDGASACNRESLKNLLIQNTAEAYSEGAPGVPFFVAEDQKFWGQDRLEDLQSTLA